MYMNLEFVAYVSSHNMSWKVLVTNRELLMQSLKFGQYEYVADIRHFAFDNIII